MEKKKSHPASCVVRETAMNYARLTGLIADGSDGLEECRVIESVGKLMALGLSVEEIADLDIRQPALQSICEYTQLDCTQDSRRRAANAVEHTLTVINDQVQGLDLQIEMLNLRKKALKRRLRILDKLARSLSCDQSDPMAA